MPWRFQISATLKAIHVMRYAMFAGGVGIALGLALRAVTGEAPLWGLAVGLGVGLWIFRGQLRPFRLPALALGRTHLFFVRRGAAVRVPWGNVKGVSPGDRGAVRVELREPGTRPDGTAGSSFELKARDFGLGPAALGALLQGYLQPARRSGLPADEEVAKAMGISGG
jgi:hypothetical protein